MTITTNHITLEKITPLRISRGVSGNSVNLIVTIEHEGITGLGELAPNGVSGDKAETGERDIEALRPALAALAPWELERVEGVLSELRSAAVGLDGVGSGGAIKAAIEMACHDWVGKKLGVPVWKLLGLDLSKTVETSVTVGIQSPEDAATQTRDWHTRTGARVLKIKLGSPEGIDADQAMFAAIQAAARPDAIFRVDANGGWSVAEAQTMIPWLAARGVEYVEQPLAQDNEDGLPHLRPAPIPIFVDETIRVASDVPRFAHVVDGVNVKLMKCGGLREALRIVAVAKAHGLKTMLGCMGETSLAITAGAQIGAAFDHLDLDSHLNLKNDPFIGASWTGGKVVPTDAPGLGVAPV
ncbi:dipeptide epimerase [Armatimonas rosea]|uniref:Dipeptide epimerase n=1 Tax=Armatimonas rosea TaxID=685828 RepID=A0A7W9SUA2_ARMRO|nr:dipeptide epimerase [Armatimonas rosea]MBB6052478.1 L-alanine-DL-glutamate epimerase-like enolase superfamily enzyme [Armatimonas rosea]